MNEPVLIDTSVWIVSLRTGKLSSVGKEVASLVQTSRALSAGLIVTEVLRGAIDEAEYRDLADYFSMFEVIEPTTSTWTHAGHLGFVLKKAGFTVPVVDLLIAQLAIENECLLLHCDRHFRDIERHSKLRQRMLGV